MSLSFALTPAEKDFLGRQARTAIDSGLAGTYAAAAPAPPQELLSGALGRRLGAFVTLTDNHALRGCIGNILGREPLYATVWHMAAAAAFQDPRFPPLTAAEWPQIHLEISVLGEPSLCLDPQAVEVGRHGLVLQYAGQSGVFLPQVPVEQGWDRLAYLENLCRKAGLPPGSWQQPGARLFWYEALVFSVPDAAAG
ncbi:AmmeMemoRadiSam system protein A [Desulfovibrio legallii]|jgi:AmmeMemoRadiSam system protein A|uniref:AMMECR1 domain-containing protein n=1 Tax=Desulfovibrio legallii TaxID=571438 RepID=A0A1G7MED7_9BACT|nr:AmmeMemoRadiSam system protein A [Desulfovibrio legallii]SDF60045.1 hypothetical protein SAMN05192586_108105 [Desulfovibrio legallii]